MDNINRHSLLGSAYRRYREAINALDDAEAEFHGSIKKGDKFTRNGKPVTVESVIRRYVIVTYDLEADKEKYYAEVADLGLREEEVK